MKTSRLILDLDCPDATDWRDLQAEVQRALMRLDTGKVQVRYEIVAWKSPPEAACRCNQRPGDVLPMRTWEHGR